MGVFTRSTFFETPWFETRSYQFLIYKHSESLSISFHKILLERQTQPAGKEHIPLINHCGDQQSILKLFGLGIFYNIFKVFQQMKNKQLAAACVLCERIYILIIEQTSTLLVHISSVSCLFIGQLKQTE